MSRKPTSQRLAPDPPEHIKPATPEWYEWYLLQDRLPGSARFVQTGLQLGHPQFARLDQDATVAVEKELRRLQGPSNQPSHRTSHLFHYRKLTVELYRKWRGKINKDVPDWFIDRAFKAWLERFRKNRSARVRRKRKSAIGSVADEDEDAESMLFEYEDTAKDEARPKRRSRPIRVTNRHNGEEDVPYHYHGRKLASARLPKLRLLDSRDSLLQNSLGKTRKAPKLLGSASASASGRRKASTMAGEPIPTAVLDEYEDVILPDAPSDLDISSFGPGQTAFDGGTPEDPPSSPNRNARISTSPECSTSGDEAEPTVPPRTKVATAVAVPTAPQQPPTSKPQATVKYEAKDEPPSSDDDDDNTDTNATTASRPSTDPPSSPMPEAGAAAAWSCLCGHPNRPRDEKRRSNFMCMDHERWIPRRQLTVFPCKRNWGKKAGWTAPKFRACVCGYPDEPKAPCEKYWLCREHKRWVPRNRLAIVEEWA